MFYVLLFTRKLSSAGYTENSRSPTKLCIQLVYLTKPLNVKDLHVLLLDVRSGNPVKQSEARSVSGNVRVICVVYGNTCILPVL